MLDIGTRLLHAWDSELHILNEDGSQEIAVGALPGSEPVTMARNLRQTGAQVVIVTKATGAIIFDTSDDTIKPYPEIGTGGVPVGTVEWSNTTRAILSSRSAAAR